MNVLSYIDPGTGSMLFSLFIGIAAAVSFGARAVFVKLKFVFTGGKLKDNLADENIPFVIYSDHKRYWNVFKPICDEFEKRKIPLVYYTQSSDDPVLSEKYEFVKAEFIGEGNKGFVRMNMLKADVVLSTTPGLDVPQWKRSRFVKCYVHILHTVDDLAGYRMFGLDYYDAVLCSGTNQESLIRKIEQLRPNIARKEIAFVGSTALDQLKTKFDTAEHPVNKQKVILVAPSWGKSGILTKYGRKLLSALQKTDYKIIVRPHPQTVVSESDILKPLQDEFTDFEWNFDNDNFDVLNRSDLLITDFSGIIFDYTMIFDKPLIYADTDFDTLPYDADWLDEKIWGLRVAESLGVKLSESEFGNISAIIENVLNSRELKSARDNIRRECWSNIGDSACLATDWLIAKQDEIAKNK